MKYRFLRVKFNTDLGEWYEDFLHKRNTEDYFFFVCDLRPWFLQWVFKPSAKQTHQQTKAAGLGVEGS